MTNEPTMSCKSASFVKVVRKHTYLQKSKLKTLKNPKSRNTKPIVKSELQLGGGGEQQVANLFNQVGHMIESILHNNWLLRLHCFTISFCLGLVEKAFPFGSLILWPVLQQHLEQACCCSHHSIPSPHHILTNEANSFSACQVILCLS